MSSVFLSQTNLSANMLHSWCAFYHHVGLYIGLSNYPKITQEHPVFLKQLIKLMKSRSTPLEGHVILLEVLKGMVGTLNILDKRKLLELVSVITSFVCTSNLKIMECHDMNSECPYSYAIQKGKESNMLDMIGLSCAEKAKHILHHLQLIQRGEIEAGKLQEESNHPAGLISMQTQKSLINYKSEMEQIKSNGNISMLSDVDKIYMKISK